MASSGRGGEFDFAVAADEDFIGAAAHFGGGDAEADFDIRELLGGEAEGKRRWGEWSHEIKLWFHFEAAGHDVFVAGYEFDGNRKSLRRLVDLGGGAGTEGSAVEDPVAIVELNIVLGGGAGNIAGDGAEGGEKFGHGSKLFFRGVEGRGGGDAGEHVGSGRVTVAEIHGASGIGLDHFGNVGAAAGFPVVEERIRLGGYRFGQKKRSRIRL